MKCPFCASPAFEGIASCPHCGFSLDLLDRIYGAIPRLTPNLCDDAGVFRPHEITRLTSAMGAFHKRFPQSSFHIVTAQLTAMENLRAYAFWLFNRASLSNDLNRGGHNHDILLTIDDANQRATLIVGYGLEPFINQEHLQHALAAGADSMKNENYFQGCRQIIKQTSQTLAQVAGDLNQTYGINTKDLLVEERKQAAIATPAPLTKSLDTPG